MALSQEEAEVRLLAELDATLDDVALTEAEYADPEQFAVAVLNNLPAIAYALQAGMPVTRWRPLTRNVAEEQRVLRAVRQWGEQARRLISEYIQGVTTFEVFTATLMAAYAQHARNSYIAGRRAVGDLAPLDATSQQALDAVTKAQQNQISGIVNAPVAGTGVGAGALLRSMFSPSAIFTPSNFLGSGLPGDPFKNLPPPLGAGGAHKKPAKPTMPKVAPEQVMAASDREVATGAMETLLTGVDNTGNQIATMSSLGELHALTAAIPGTAVLSWWVLGAADHCIDCVRLSAMSPYYASRLAADGIFPGSGHTRCGYRCACHIEHQVPAEICTDPMSGPGDLSAVGLLEGADGRTVNVYIQEASACRNPQSIDAFAASRGLIATPGADPFNWDQDVSAAITASDSIPYADLPTDVRNAFSFLTEIVPGGKVEALQATRYEIDGNAYHAIWQRTGDAVRFEAGATTAGLGVLDPDFTLRAIHDLAAIADREGLRVEVNGATRNAGMARWLDTLGADHATLGAGAPSLEPNFAEMGALAERAMPKAGIAPGLAPGALPMPNPDSLVATGTDVLEGITPKTLLRDPATGVEWMWKPGNATDIVREEDVSRLHVAAGLQAPVSYATKREGVDGTLTEIIPDARSLSSIHGHDRSDYAPYFTDPRHADELARANVVDYVTNNLDANAGNFILDANGQVWGIDFDHAPSGIMQAAYNNYPERFTGSEGVKRYFDATSSFGGSPLNTLVYNNPAAFFASVHPESFAAAFERLDGLGKTGIEALLPHFDQQAQAVVQSRAATAREGYADFMRSRLDKLAAKGGEIPPDWQAFLKDGWPAGPKAGIAPGAVVRPWDLSPAWTLPDPAALVPWEEHPYVRGVSAKAWIWDPATGQGYFLKPYPVDKGGISEVVAAELFADVGLRTVAPKEFTWVDATDRYGGLHPTGDPVLRGALMPVFTDVADIPAKEGMAAFVKGGSAAAAAPDLARAQIGDWAFANDDGTYRNYMVGADGHAMGIDKDRALTQLNDASPLKMGTTYGETMTPGNAIWTQGQAGIDILKDLHPSDVGGTIDQIDAIGTAAYKARITPVVTARKKARAALESEFEPWTQPSVAALVARKDSTRSAFSDLYREGLQKATSDGLDIPPDWQAWLANGGMFEPPSMRPKAGIAPRVTTILPTPTFVLPEVDALPAWPDMGLLKSTGKAKGMAGNNPKKMLADPSGQEWLFKIGVGENPHAEASAAALGRRLGMRVPPVEVATWDNIEGALQPIIANAKSVALIGAENLTDAQIRDVWTGSVLDFVVANADTHTGNYIVDDAGRLWSIDKGRAFSGLTVTATRPEWQWKTGILTDPAASRVFRATSPADFGAVFNRLDGISEAELHTIADAAMPAVANPFGTVDDSFALLVQRKAIARQQYESWFRTVIDSAPDAEISPEWQKWRKAGGVFKEAPVAPAGQPTRLLPKPASEAPPPASWRSTTDHASRVGNDLATAPDGFMPAMSRAEAETRIAAALPKTTGNILGGFSLDQLNAITARAESMAAQGVDMSQIIRLGDFTKVPVADAAKGIGLTYKGDRIALNHDHRWKFLAGVDSPDTVYNDIGGLFAHEYGHVAFAHLGAEQQGKVIALYRTHAAEAGKDLSTYAAGDVDEWVGEMMAAVTAPGYVPGTIAYDEAFWTSLVADGPAKGVVKADKAPGLLKVPPPVSEVVPVATSPIGPPKSAPKQAWFKHGDPQQYTLPESALPLNVPHAQWSGYIPPEPPLPSVATTKEAVAAAKAAHDAVLIDWQDISGGKAKVAFAWDKTDTEAALAAGLHVEKIGTSYVAAHGATDLQPLKDYVASGGRTDDDAFWHLMGYSDADLAAYDAYYAAKKGLRLTGGVVMVEPDGRMWLLAPRNKFAGYENTWIKGGVDTGETTAQAAVREMMEEAGFSVELDRYLGDYVNTDRTGVARMYVGHRSGGGPLWAHAKETYEVRLVEPSEAADMLVRYGKPDERDQKILADAVAALKGSPGVDQIIVPATDAAEMAAKTAPEPVVWWPQKKDSWSTPKPGVAPEPPISTAFGFDHDVWKTFTPSEIPKPSDNSFQFNTTRWTLADGTPQPMYWQVKGGLGTTPTTDMIFWANSKKQLPDPHMRLSLHVAQITRFADQMTANPTIDVLRVNQALLDSVPGLADLFVAAGAKAGPGKWIEIGAPELQKLSAAVKGNTPLGAAVGSAVTPPISAVPVSTGSLAYNAHDVADLMSAGVYAGVPAINLTNTLDFAGTSVSWNAFNEIDLLTGLPRIRVNGPGAIDAAERDAILVATAAHMASVAEQIPGGVQGIRFGEATWGDLSAIGPQLGMTKEFETWVLTPEQATTVRDLVKADIAPFGYHNPALLSFNFTAATLPQPPLTGLYDAKKVKRLSASFKVNYPITGVQYEVGGTLLNWKMTGNPLSNIDQTMWFTQMHGTASLPNTLAVLAHMRIEEPAAIYTLGFSKKFLDGTPGLAEILKAHGATTSFPGFALWMDEASSSHLLEALATADLTAPGAIVAIATPPVAPIATYNAPAAAAAAATQAGAVPDLLTGMTEKKIELVGVGPVTETTFAKGQTTWRRWSNTLELHEMNGGTDTLSAHIVRMGKVADAAEKVDRLRILPGVILTDDAKAMLKAAGAVEYPGGMKIDRKNLLALRDQILQDAKTQAPVAAFVPTLLPTYSIDPVLAGALTPTVTPLKWDFETVTWKADTHAAVPVTIRHRVLKDTIAWDTVMGKVAGIPQPDLMAAGTRHLGLLADKLAANPALKQIRFENLDQMPGPWKQMLVDHGLYAQTTPKGGTIWYLKRDDAIALRDAIEPELGHAAVTQVVAAIAPPPVTSFVESLYVDHASVKALLAETPYATQVGGWTKHEWSTGASSTVNLLPGNVMRIGPAISTTSVAERRAALLREIWEQSSYTAQGLFSAVEIASTATVGAWGGDLRNALLKAGAVDKGAGEIVIDNVTVAKAVRDAIEHNTPLAEFTTPQGVPKAVAPTPASTGVKLSDQIGYAKDVLDGTTVSFASDELSMVSGDLLLNVPYQTTPWTATFEHNAFANTLEMAVTGNSDSTEGALAALQQIAGAHAVGTLQVDGLVIAGLPQKVSDMLAAEGIYTDAGIHALTMKDLNEFVALVDADVPLSYVVGGSAAAAIPLATALDPLTIAGVGADDWHLISHGPLPEKILGTQEIDKVDHNYFITPTGAAWMNASAVDLMTNTEMVQHSMAFMADFLAGTQLSGTKIIVIGKDVTNTMPEIGKVMQAYGVQDAGTIWNMTPAQAKKIVDDITASVGTIPAPVPLTVAPALPPAGPTHVPSWPAKYGFDGQSSIATAIPVTTELKYGFVNADMGSGVLVKYRTSGSGIQFLKVAGTNPQMAPEAFVATIEHFGTMLDANPALKTVRFATDGIPTPQLRTLLTDEGKAVLAPDGTHLVVARQDFLDMRANLKADLAGTGIPTSAIPTPSLFNVIPVQSGGHIGVGDLIYGANAAGGPPPVFHVLSVNPADGSATLKNVSTGIEYVDMPISTAPGLHDPLTVGSKVKITNAPLGDPLVITSISPEGKVTLTYEDGTPSAQGMHPALLTPVTSAAAAASPLPAPKPFLNAGIDETTLASFEKGLQDSAAASYDGKIQPWGSKWVKAYSTWYTDPSITPMIDAHGYQQKAVVGAASPSVAVRGKRHAARWSLESVLYGTEEQQAAALWLHFTRMVHDSDGLMPIFLSNNVLASAPRLKTYLISNGAKAKDLANYGGLGVDVDKKTVAKLKAKIETGAAATPIAQPIAPTVNPFAKSGPVTLTNASIGDKVVNAQGTAYTVSNIQGSVVTFLNDTTGSEYPYDISYSSPFAHAAGVTPLPTPAAPVAAPVVPASPVVPAGAIGGAPVLTGGVIPGPATAPKTLTPSFLYGYDAAHVAAAVPVDLGTASYGSGKVVGDRKVMQVGQAKAYWDTAASGSRTGLFGFEPVAGMTVEETRSAAFAMLLHAAADGATRPKGFFIKPEFYDKVDGLRQMILDAGGSEADWPNLGLAVAMDQPSTQKLVDALRADEMGPIKPGFKSTSEYLGYTHSSAVATFGSVPVVNAKKGEFAWTIGTKKGTVTATVAADRSSGAIFDVVGDTVSMPVSAAAQIAWLADQGASMIEIHAPVLDKVAGLRQWLLTVGGKVDGSLIRLDDTAIGNAAKSLAKDALPVGLGGKALPYSVLDSLRANPNDVVEGLTHHSVNLTGPVNTSEIVVGPAKISTRWTRSGTNIYWESVDGGGATIGKVRAGVAAQLRTFAETVGQDVSIERLDLAANMLAKQPGLLSVIQKYGGKAVTPAQGDAYWTMTRTQVAKMRKDIESEFAQIGTGAATSYIDQQAALIVWPSAEDLAYDKSRSGALAGAKTTAGSVSASQKLAIYTDAAGNEWLFKPGATGRGAQTDMIVADLAKTLGLPVPPSKVYTLEFDGKVRQGSLQKMLPGAKGVKSTADLDPKQTEDMLRHSVLDWLTNNDDGHAGNWLIAPDGHLWAIDKSRSFQTWGRDRLANDYAGNGFKPLLMEFFTRARTDPALLKSIHPQTLASTLRKVSAIDDADYRRMMRPLAEANTRSPAEADRMLNQIVARKNAVVTDFETYLSGEIDYALKAHRGAVPKDWADWKARGGKINVNATKRDLGLEDFANLNAEFGTFDPQKAAQIMRDAQLMPIDSALRSYFRSGTHGGAQVTVNGRTMHSYESEKIRPEMLARGMQAQLERWQRVQRWAFLNVMEGGGTSLAGSYADDLVRKWWNADEWTLRVTRTAAMRGKNTAETVDYYLKNGFRDMVGSASGKWTEVGAGSTPVYMVIELDPGQVFSTFLMGYSNTGASTGENELMIVEVRGDQIVSIDRRESPVGQIAKYAGPVVNPTYR